MPSHHSGSLDYRWIKIDFIHNRLALKKNGFPLLFSEPFILSLFEFKNIETLPNSGLQVEIS